MRAVNRQPLFTARVTLRASPPARTHSTPEKPSTDTDMWSDLCWYFLSGKCSPKTMTTTKWTPKTKNLQHSTKPVHKWSPGCADHLMCFPRKWKISSYKVDHHEKNSIPGRPETLPLSIHRLRIHYTRSMSIHRLRIHYTRPWPSESTKLERESKFRCHKKSVRQEGSFQNA